MVDLIDRPESQEAGVLSSPKQLPDIDRIKLIKAILDPVYPLTIDQWRDVLMRGGNPRYQLAWWTGFAEIYRHSTAGLPPEKHRQVFEHLMGRGFGTTAPDPGE